MSSREGAAPEDSSWDVTGDIVSDDREHVALGIEGQHAQTLPALPHPTLLLELRIGTGSGRVVMRIDGGQSASAASGLWADLARNRLSMRPLCRAASFTVQGADRRSRGQKLRVSFA